MAPSQRERLRAGRAFLAGAVAAVSLLAACGGSNDSTPESRAEASGSPSPRDALPPAEDIEAAGASRLKVSAADWIQVVDGSAWTTLAGLAAVRLASPDGKETARIPTASETCLAMDAAFGSLWIGICSDPSAIMRIDPRTGKVLATIPLPGLSLIEESSLGAGEGSVWAVSSRADQFNDKTLVRIDPATNTVADQFLVPSGVVGARAGLGGVWLTDTIERALLRIDPRSGQTIASVKTGAEARFFDVGEESIWMHNVDGTVSRVDPASNKVIATIQVDEGNVNGGDIQVGGGYVWARVSSALVSQIDPRTNTVVARYGPASGSGAVAADTEAVWITAHDVDAVYRLPLG